MSLQQYFSDEDIEIIQKIVSLFHNEVKGKLPDVSTNNLKHDGRYGHWLETKMSISHNGKNEPDLYGFEMKNNTTSKTTFGDWSANYYIFSKSNPYNLTRHDFMMIFGKYNKEKDRFSWSGQPFPKYGIFNSWGQILKVDENENLVIEYHYSKDSRENKDSVVPLNLRVDGLILARWDKESIKQKVENKFNMRGWFKCLQSKDGTYDSIVFGMPITYDSWLERVKTGHIFLDSGMYSDINKPNIRPYQSWRAGNKFWDSLIVAKF